MNKQNKKCNKGIKALVVILLVAGIIVGGCGVYVNDYYRAQTEEIAVFFTNSLVEEKEIDDGVIAFLPPDPVAGFIFYPGGKVEYTAYKPLMIACAQKGILCVLVEMPFNLAVLDVNRADGIVEKFPQIEKWAIGGHSLGGSMAASYIGSHAAQFNDLVLLGSYSTVDLNSANVDVLSIYGSEDGVMNREKYAEYKPNLPKNTVEFVIDGGNHSGFGMYGFQEGDGEATITNDEQINITAGKIADVIFG